MAAIHPFTMPVPELPDIEIQRMIGNISNLTMRNCTKCGPAKPSVNVSDISSLLKIAEGDDDDLWVSHSQSVLYYSFPIILGWGAVTALIGILCMIWRIKSANDSYLLGLLISAFFLLSCGAVSKLQDYTPYSAIYQQMFPYFKTANDWFWFTSLWILIMMALDRGMATIQRRQQPLCTPFQASLVTFLIFCVCLVSALPQFWEYEMIEVFDYSTNQSRLESQLTTTSNSPEYFLMYFWYTVTITVFLPYPIMLTMIVVLVRGMKRMRRNKKRLADKHAHTAMILRRKTKEEIHVVRLHIVLLLSYITLTGPYTFLVLVYGVTPTWAWPQDGLYTGLYTILEFVFYFYYASLFLLFCSYSDSFRRCLRKTCCCCCIRRQRREQEMLIYTR